MPPANACAMPASELEPILWVRQQNERRKGREGRKPRILRKQGPFRGRREVAETRRKPAETLRSLAVSPQRCPACAFSGEHTHRLRKLRKFVSAVSAGRVTALQCGRSSHTPPTWRAPRGPARRTAR